jgi:AraC-like DNA-binding protein
MNEKLLNIKRLSLENYDSFVHCFTLYDKYTQIDSTIPAMVDFVGFIICQKGYIDIEINDNKFHAESGYLITLFPNSIINSASCSEDFDGIGLVVRNDYLREVGAAPTHSVLMGALNIKDRPIIKLSHEQEEDLISMYEVIKSKHSRKNYPFKNEITGFLLISFFFEIFAIYQTERITKQSSHTRKEDIFKKFLILLSEYSNRERSVEFYARELCISPKYLSTLVTNVSGRSASNWISQAVISNAKTLLRNSDLSIQQISMELNFPNSSFFGQYFKRNAGVTPNAYRKKF